jgi:hypothetical protein
MVSVFVRVDKVVIGFMFWIFIGMLLNVFLGYLELAVEIMQYKLVFFIVTMCKC